ncbi:hypothetical protein J5226_01455 [Lysobacter sp. K5869]|uniref:hypothetical protein n=1 Tax=Lysobacter sp. K5869 TaxID=2820808 RepID=UPI001C0602B2|nr:hypothetical protein [Lysobacter sp. K5869]QWP77101.1 hypothetical protein J5226_01455 [Lysobacter sp. K5869]
MSARIVLLAAAGLLVFAGHAEEAADYRTREAACFAHPTRACVARLERRCKILRGDWGGTLSGRGRMPGCNLPTRDGGKACRVSEQCQSACVYDGPVFVPPGAQPAASTQCRCYPMQSLRKGAPLRLCTARGIEMVHID